MPTESMIATPNKSSPSVAKPRSITAATPACGEASCSPDALWLSEGEGFGLVSVKGLSPGEAETTPLVFGVGPTTPPSSEPPVGVDVTEVVGFGV